MTTRKVAQRIVNAEEKFITYCVERDFTRDQAERILKVYRKIKAIKIDPVGGQFTFTHGSFGDVEVLRQALIQSS